MLEIIKGVIDRRILINYRIAPERLARLLPPPFTPRLVNGHGIGGLCLIRFKKMRPAGLPAIFGTASENATHRFCVEWNENGTRRTGIYVKQRFTNSRLHAFGGDKLFPGRLAYAEFQVSEGGGAFQVSFRSRAGENGRVALHQTECFPHDSVFGSLEAASEDFQNDRVGYSPARGASGFTGVKLNTTDWKVTPLRVDSVESSLFENLAIFPDGSAEIDHAFLMKDIAHSWQQVETLCGDY